jgi:hypothetical protein
MTGPRGAPLQPSTGPVIGGPQKIPSALTRLVPEAPIHPHPSDNSQSRSSALDGLNVTAGLRLAVFNWREAYSKALDAWNKVRKEAQDSLKAPEKPDPMVRHARP